MASSAQILANRTNAALSTGPQTEAGRATSSRNALTHGMTSKQVVLPHENQHDYDTFRDALVTSLRPEGEHEDALAEAVAAAWWRLQRMLRIENALLALRIEATAGTNLTQTEGDFAAAAVLADPAEAKRMALTLRYVTAAERAHRNAIRTLEQAQKARRQHEREAAVLEAMKEEIKEETAPSIPENLTRSERRAIERAQRKAARRTQPTGFVSYAAPNAA